MYSYMNGGPAGDGTQGQVNNEEGCTVEPMVRVEATVSSDDTGINSVYYNSRVY